VTATLPHISVCICTRHRLDYLERLLHSLGRLNTAGAFRYSIVVADNDAAQSAQPLVCAFAESSPVPTVYGTEPRQNIALARNRALQDATGDFIAFIDDDEFPDQDWLLALFKAHRAYAADGVVGPVLPHFEQEPPKWIRQGGFCERPTHHTGFVIDWAEGRTGNVLFRRGILDGIAEPFRPEFGSGGEDRDFFRRMIGNGRIFVWCNEAVVHESVPPVRMTRSFMLRRALLRGKVAAKNPTFAAIDLVRSVIALPAYVTILPLLLLLGHHLFMKYLIKTCDHLGRILALLGIEVVREKYVTE
jgi:succinoglycan biosynthesis protein ExoM